jgi:CheY-like chemotaxis protein
LVGRGGRILVVEDNELIRAEVATILSLEGFEVVEAENGRDGLRCLAAARPDLILSDLMMPEMDGFAFLEAARTNALWANIPFVVLSARGEQEAAERALALGARRFLTKPVDVQDLLDIVTRALETAPSTSDGGSGRDV